MIILTTEKKEDRNPLQDNPFASFEMDNQAEICHQILIIQRKLNFFEITKQLRKAFSSSGGNEEAEETEEAPHL